MPPALPTYTANLLKYSQTNSSVASIDEIIVHHTSHRTTQLQEVEDKEDEEEDKVEPLSPYAMQPPTHTHSPHQTTAALELLQQRPSHSPFQHYQRPASSSSSPIQTLLLLQPLSYSTESKSEPKPKPEPKPEPEPKLELVSTAAIMAASACPPPMSKLRAPTITSNSSNAFDGNNHSDYNSHDNTRNGRITNQNNINDYDPDYTNGISKYSSPPPAFQPQQQQKSQSPKPQFQSHHPPISYNDNSSYTPHNGSGMPQHMRPQLQPASRPAQIPPVSNHVFAMHPNPASPLSPKHTQPIVYPQQQQMGAPNASSRGLVGKAPSTNLFRNSRSNLKADVHNAENGQPTSRFATLLNRTTGRLNKNRDRDLLNRIYGEERDLLAKKNETNHRRYHPWRFASIMCTCCLPACLLSACGMSNPLIRQAFREKLTLCILIMLSMLVVVFLAVGMPLTICSSMPRFDYTNLTASTNFFTVRGSAYEMIPGKSHANLVPRMFPNVPNDEMIGSDLSFLFPIIPEKSACTKLLGASYKRFKCILPATWPNPLSGKYIEACHDSPSMFGKYLRFTNYIGEVYVDYDKVQQSKTLLVYSNTVLDISRLEENPNVLGKKFHDLVLENLGHDATRAFVLAGFKQEAECLREIFHVATVDATPIGCNASLITVYAGFISTVSIVLLKFVVALYFAFVIGWRMGDRPRKDSARGLAARTPWNKDKPLQSHRLDKGTPQPNRLNLSPNPTNGQYQKRDMLPNGGGHGYDSLSEERKSESSLSIDSVDAAVDSAIIGPSINSDPSLLRTLILIPCFSESEESLSKTLDSIVDSEYPISHKTILVVADGLIKGAGNLRMTHEYLIGMMEMDRRFSNDTGSNGEPSSYSYVSIGEGKKRKNYARVYAGWYIHSSFRTKATDKGGRGKQKPPRNAGELPKRVPIIVVNKVGIDEERLPQNMSNRPGCRGKRDSQVLLMNFLSVVMTDGRMSELEFELFYKLWKITGVHPANYETVLMVDADTVISRDSISHMVASLTADPRIIGICGETKIANKFESWVTMIQVYEYYISHHYSKAFESMFGSVTCLPGCFSMYRITSLTSSGASIPILAHTTLIDQYAENIVETLHRKNLLLLGEDRYLSCLLLKLFPRRQLVYTPRAICQTTVPVSFKVLLSQRRRWINSTIHNLLELLMVNTLCGTLCVSMQFVIFMELVGTVTMPAAVLLLGFLVIQAIFTKIVSFISILFLISMIFLPPILVLITSRRIEQFFWFLVYILALPIWQFILPLYAFWHFDDFTWGSTRKLHDQEDNVRHRRTSLAPGQFDALGIRELPWREWVAVRRRERRAYLQPNHMVKGASNNMQGRPFERTPPQYSQHT